jgi:hypothetical protein
MFIFLLTLIGLFVLWFLTGLGMSFYLTRQTPLFRYFVGLSILFAQVLVVLSSTVMGTYKPGRISVAMMLLVHGAGIGLSAWVLRRLGWRRLWRFAKYRVTIPIGVILLTSVVVQVGPCLERSQPCYVSHNNDEYLNYSASAQWAAGDAPGSEFIVYWRDMHHHRFGADLQLAYLSRELSVPAIYAILPLQALARIQYLFAAVLVFHFLYPGSGWRRRWGAFAVALFLYISPLEFQNYILAFLAHHVASAAMAVLCATMLVRPTLPLAILQGWIFLYLGVTYIEVIPIMSVLLGAHMSWQAWRESTVRPLLYLAGVVLTTLGSIQLRDPASLSGFIFRTGVGGTGFYLLGDPAVSFWSYLAGLLSLRADQIGAVFTSSGWLQGLAAAVGVGLLGWGLFQAAILRKHFWMLLVVLVVFALHFDIGVLLSGKIQLVTPVYPGPKAFLYFHFLWIALIAAGVLNTFSDRSRRTLALGIAAIWGLPVLLTGAQYMIQAQAWPAVWSAFDDLALAAKIPPGAQLIVDSSRPSEENLWRQVMAYVDSPTGSAAGTQAGATPSAAYVLPRYAYYFSSPQGLIAKRRPQSPCSKPLGTSAGFLLCGVQPISFPTTIQLSGSVSAWNADIQPLVFCGQPGAAVFWGLKRVDASNASLVINQWGSELMSSPPFPLAIGQPFQFTALINRQNREVAIANSTGEATKFTLGAHVPLESCIPEVGLNPTEAAFLSKKFNGLLTGQFLR